MNEDCSRVKEKGGGRNKSGNGRDHNTEAPRHGESLGMNESFLRTHNPAASHRRTSKTSVPTTAGQQGQSLPAPRNMDTPTTGDESSLQTPVIVATAVMLALSITTVSLRFYTRRAFLGSLGAEDWTILAAVVCGLLNCGKRATELILDGPDLLGGSYCWARQASVPLPPIACC
jgi:hypothetical protein